MITMREAAWRKKFEALIDGAPTITGTDYPESLPDDFVPRWISITYSDDKRIDRVEIGDPRGGYLLFSSWPQVGVWHERMPEWLHKLVSEIVGSDAVWCRRQVG